MPGPRQPWDWFEARDASRAASASQKAAEDQHAEAAREAAAAEEIYRVELAKCIVKEHAAGVAWTVCQDIARGDPAVAKLRYERDVKAGVLAAAEQRAWRGTADRKDVTQLSEWSMRLDCGGVEATKRAA